jgi:hypothetical protein
LITKYGALIKKHPEFSSKKFYTFYHGTTLSRAKNILKYGLNVGSYVTRDDGFAEIFAIRDLDENETGAILSTKIKGENIGLYQGGHFSRYYNPEEEEQPELEIEERIVLDIISSKPPFIVVDPLFGGENWGYIVTKKIKNWSLIRKVKR